MTAEDWQLRDPGRIVADVMADHPLRGGDAFVLCVRDAPREQAVTSVVRIDPAHWRNLDRDGQSQFLARTAQCLPIPDWQRGAPPNHSIVTLVVRRGLAVIGPAEAEWMVAWHYSNHLMHAFSADLILVTEHGWADFMTGWGGYEPSLQLVEVA
jgi:hypothetical protein